MTAEGYARGMKATPSAASVTLPTPLEHFSLPHHGMVMHLDASVPGWWPRGIKLSWQESLELEGWRDRKKETSRFSCEGSAGENDSYTPNAFKLNISVSAYITNVFIEQTFKKYSKCFLLYLVHFFAVSFRYNKEAQGSWKNLSSAEYRDSYALSSLGDNLYLIGGQMKLKNQFLFTNSVERWSLNGGPWRSAAPLPMPLAYHSVVRMKGRLYVLGGRTPQVNSKSANWLSSYYSTYIYIYCRLKKVINSS